MIRQQHDKPQLIIAGVALLLACAQLAFALPRHLVAAPGRQPVTTPIVAAQQQVPLSSALYLPLIQRGSDPAGTGQDEYTLLTTSNGQGNPNVSPNQTSYRSGQVVSLTVIAAPGWQFSGWSGDLSGHDNPATVTMLRNYVITANFVQPSAAPTATNLPVPTNTPFPTPINTPTFTNTPINTPINTPTFTNTPINTP